VNASEGASQLKLSPDGRYAVFVSAQRLTPSDTNNYQQVWLRNLQTRATTLVSVGSDGQAGNANSSGGQFAGAAISADDRYVAFTSAASNLVPGGTSGGLNNVFVRDLAAGTTSLVSVHLAGVTGNNGAYGSGGPVISADGRYCSATRTGCAAEREAGAPLPPCRPATPRRRSSPRRTAPPTRGAGPSPWGGYTENTSPGISAMRSTTLR
jgi:Tol biopolymer transport system component